MTRRNKDGYTCSERMANHAFELYMNDTDLPSKPMHGMTYKATKGVFNGISLLEIAHNGKVIAWLEMHRLTLFSYMNDKDSIVTMHRKDALRDKANQFKYTVYAMTLGERT